MANLSAFPWPLFPHLPTGENPIGGQPTVLNKRVKGNWENAGKVREVDFLKLFLSVYLKV